MGVDFELSWERVGVFFTRNEDDDDDNDNDDDDDDDTRWTWDGRLQILPSVWPSSMNEALIFLVGSFFVRRLE